MQGNRYFAKDNPDAFERERLAVRMRTADPIPTRRLTDLNPRFLAGHGLPRTGVGSPPPPDGAVVWRAA
jgi:hypothetical protein